jgi:biopolymer transport protein ExbD
MPIQIRRGRSVEMLNLTSLMDVVFLLLIFFLVASRFAQEDRELPVQLPSATSAMPMTSEPQEVVVNIDERGSYFVSGAVMDAAALERTLQTAVVNNPTTLSVIIRGDRRVPFQYVVDVMDLCNRLGISNYKVSTASQET